MADKMAKQRSFQIDERLRKRHRSYCVYHVTVMGCSITNVSWSYQVFPATWRPGVVWLEVWWCFVFFVWMVMAEAINSMTASAFNHATSGNNNLLRLSGCCWGYFLWIFGAQSIKLYFVQFYKLVLWLITDKSSQFYEALWKPSASSTAIGTSNHLQV